MNDCLFCKIVRKEIPAAIVHEDDDVVAFLDTKPVNPGHVLVVPKRHSEDYASTGDKELTAAVLVARNIGRALLRGLGVPAFNIGVNNGQAAGQVINHLHIHVMPRREADGHELWHGRPYGDGEASSVAEKIKNALNG